MRSSDPIQVSAGGPETFSQASLKRYDKPLGLPFEDACRIAFSFTHPGVILIALYEIDHRTGYVHHEDLILSIRSLEMELEEEINRYGL